MRSRRTMASSSAMITAPGAGPTPAPAAARDHSLLTWLSHGGQQLVLALFEVDHRLAQRVTGPGHHVGVALRLVVLLGGQRRLGDQGAHPGLVGRLPDDRQLLVEDGELLARPDQPVCTSRIRRSSRTRCMGHPLYVATSSADTSDGRSPAWPGPRDPVDGPRRVRRAPPPSRPPRVGSRTGPRGGRRRDPPGRRPGRWRPGSGGRPGPGSRPGQPGLEEPAHEDGHPGRGTGGVRRPRGTQTAQAGGFEAGHRARPVAQGVVHAPGRGQRLVEADRDRQPRRQLGQCAPGRPAAVVARRSARRGLRGGSASATWSSSSRKEPLASTWITRSGWSARTARTGAAHHPGSTLSRTLAAPASTAASTAPRSAPGSRSAGMPTTAPTGIDSKPAVVPSAAASDRPSARSSRSVTAISKVAPTWRSTAEVPNSCGTVAANGRLPWRRALATAMRRTRVRPGPGRPIPAAGRPPCPRPRRRTRPTPHRRRPPPGRRAAGELGARRPRCRSRSGTARRGGPARPPRASPGAGRTHTAGHLQRLTLERRTPVLAHRTSPCTLGPSGPDGGMADAEASKASVRKGVRVRVPLRARLAQ